MTPFAVDANAVHDFQRERIEQRKGIAHSAIDAILGEHCIAMDQEKLCLQEWLDCAGGKFPFALTDWIADQAAVGRIRFFPLSSNTCGQSLRKQGLPQKDQKWVRLALGCGGRKIVSGDIDFFDPTKKNASSRTKGSIRQKRKGPLSKFLRKEYDVEVMCLEHVDSVLEKLRE